MSAAVSQRPLLRWSSVRDCGRKAVYEATGAPGRDLTEQERRRLFRGKRIGRDYAELLSLKHNSRDSHRKFIRARGRSEERGGGYYGAGNVWAEKKVVWELGVGHMDIWLPKTATAVEVLSSAHGSARMVRSKLLQLVGYIEHDPEAENGALVVLDPSDLSEERHRVSRHSATYADLVSEMRERIGQVQAWDATGEMPPRVCSKPGDARSHFCVYADTCFQGWTAPELPLLEDADLRDAAERLHAIKAERRDIGRRDRTLQAEQKTLQAALDEIPVGGARVGPYLVKRTKTERSPSFDWKRAELAGMFEPGLYDEFFKPGAVYDTFDVIRDGADDYGDEAPF